METIKHFYSRLNLFYLIAVILALGIASPLALKLINLCSLYLAG